MHAQFSDKKHKELSNSTYVSYYKLPYIGNLWAEIKQKFIKRCKYYCKSTNIKIVLSLFKVRTCHFSGLLWNSGFTTKEL